MKPLLPVDLDYVDALMADCLSDFKGARLFLTGGTGFFGAWLVECLVDLNRRHSLNLELVLLTRNPSAFVARMPHLAEAGICFHPGDIRDFDFPDRKFTHVIHAAASSSVPLGAGEMEETLVKGARRTLKCAHECGASKFLYVSSGAVYGKQPLDLELIPEDFPVGREFMDARQPYAEGKRMGEKLCLEHGKEYGLQVKIARCFAFVGPHLPLGAHFAVGNFIRDALEGRDIRIKEDGSAVRSYMYAADLVVWLAHILCHGVEGRAYNVGSESPVDMGELATACAGVIHPESRVIIEKERGVSLPDRYVPDCRRAREELHLGVVMNLPEALHRTMQWLCPQARGIQS